MPKVSHRFALDWSLSGFSAHARACFASFVKDAAYSEKVEHVTISRDVAWGTHTSVPARQTDRQTDRRHSDGEDDAP